MKKISYFLFIAFFSYTSQLYAQCPTAGGDEVTYGAGSWIGYVYDGADNFASTDYQGQITETELFDESFCGNNCTFAIDGCDINTETFSVRFRMRQTFACGTYDITIGADDGVRLSIDGGSTYVIDDYGLHGYRTSGATIALDGTYDLVLEYFEQGGGNRVSFTYTSNIGASSAGEISGDQTYCSADGTVDPTILSSVDDASICGFSETYQWQSSTDNITFSNIGGANSTTYDPPSGLTQTTYYHRQATGGATTVTSNVVIVTVQSPAGDQTTSGSGSWIGYVYEGTDNFASADYRGFVTESEIFDQSFGGSNTPYSTNGCDVTTETFTVRYKMQQTFACGTYDITIGGDDGVRLSIDGGSTFIIDGYSNQPYTTYSETVALDGSYDLVLEYYEASGDNRVSFDYSSNLGVSFAGEVSSDQSFCSVDGAADPSAFTSISEASICGSTETYQWQSSTDNIIFSNISGANSATHDPPSGLTQTTYYRRQVSGGATTLESNVITVTYNTPSGDEVSYGSGSWIGYVYDGADNYASADYMGSIGESLNFDESFGGNTATLSTNGCQLTTETFTVRFKLEDNFVAGDYLITVGADDGVRFSADGGVNFDIVDYSDHGYRTSSATLSLDGTEQFVLEYYENGGGNRISFNISAVSLPVTWLSFDGSYNETTKRTKLDWSTASEENNDYFEIQRSIDGVTYELLATIDGSGTTSSVSKYEFEDVSPLAGASYYRLKQVDFDGQFDYSKVVLVKTISDENFKLYPNPATSYLKLDYQGPEVHAGQISLYNSVGVVVKRIPLELIIAGNKINLNGLNKGIYIAEINTNNTIVRQRFIVE